jgi:hypothetical protein
VESRVVVRLSSYTSDKKPTPCSPFPTPFFLFIKKPLLLEKNFFLNLYNADIIPVNIDQYFYSFIQEGKMYANI